MVMIVTVSVAICAGAIWALLVPRIRIDDPAAPELRSLVSWRSTALVATATLAASQVLRVAPVAHWWVWVGYLAFGVPLVAIDLRTTFLPARLNLLALGAMAVGAVPMAVSEPGLGLRALLGAGALFGFFWLVWRIGAGIGFGDVRLASLIGAVAGLSGAQGVATALVAGTLLGACHAIGHLIWARRRPDRPRHFAYGPALYAGPILASGVSAIAG